MRCTQCCDSFRGTAKGLSVHTHVSILPQAPLPSRLPQSIEQSSLCHTVGPCSVYMSFPDSLIIPSSHPSSSACKHAKSLQSCLILCHPTDCSPPGSSVHGILQARTLAWVAISLLHPEIKPMSRYVSCIVGMFLSLAPPGKPILPPTTSYSHPAPRPTINSREPLLSTLKDTDS